jgi:hypothetical protein
MGNYIKKGVKVYELLFLERGSYSLKCSFISGVFLTFSCQSDLLDFKF